jgi:hypothetical protein
MDMGFGFGCLAQCFDYHVELEFLYQLDVRGVGYPSNINSQIAHHTSANWQGIHRNRARAH